MIAAPATAACVLFAFEGRIALSSDHSLFAALISSGFIFN